MYFRGVPTLLSAEAEVIAEQGREEHFETDPRTEAVAKYCDMYVPTNWEKMFPLERRMYYENYDEDEITKEECVQMDFVSATGVLVEALGFEVGKIKARDASEINDILNKLPGWERSRQRVRSYGQQRGFKRIVNADVDTKSES